LVGAAVCGLGIPVAFVAGRHLAPIAREAGSSGALLAAGTFAVLAPPLGDAEIVLGPLLAPWIWEQPAWGSVPISLLAFTFGLGVSYIVLPITVAVGVVWLSLMRLVPPAVFVRLTVPAPFDRLGVRHLFLVLFIWFVVIQVAWAIAGPQLRW